MDEYVWLVTQKAWELDHYRNDVLFVCATRDSALERVDIYSYLPGKLVIERYSVMP
jgi:hypothetical protein